MSRRAALRDMLARPGPALAGMARAAEGPTKLKEGGGEIEVSFESDGFDLPRTALLEWVRTAARAVSAYYGRFPCPARACGFSRAADRAFRAAPVSETTACAGVTVGRHTTAADLHSDWMMTHEMVHFARFPPCRAATTGSRKDRPRTWSPSRGFRLAT